MMDDVSRYYTITYRSALSRIQRASDIRATSAIRWLDADSARNFNLQNRLVTQ